MVNVQGEPWLSLGKTVPLEVQAGEIGHQVAQPGVTQVGQGAAREGIEW